VVILKQKVKGEGHSVNILLPVSMRRRQPVFFFFFSFCFDIVGHTTGSCKRPVHVKEPNITWSNCRNLD